LSDDKRVPVGQINSSEKQVEESLHHNTAFLGRNVELKDGKVNISATNPVTMQMTSMETTSIVSNGSLSNAKDNEWIKVDQTGQALRRSSRKRKGMEKKLEIEKKSRSSKLKIRVTTTTTNKNNATANNKKLIILIKLLI
jgi:hypothetical protein